MTPVAARPCPFCGRHLRRTKTGYYHPSVKEQWDDPRGLCFFNGMDIGIKVIERWNRRDGTLYMEIEDDHPKFNRAGAGKPVEDDMLNATVQYYRQKAGDL